MFLHAISPSRAFAKVAKSLFRRTELDPDTRLLLAYVGDLLPSADGTHLPLARHAEELGISPGAYKRIKKQLVQYGYVHDHRHQVGGGRWVTDQWVSNVPLSEEQFRALREGGTAGLSSDGHRPTVGRPSAPSVGGSTGTSQTNSKTYPTRPPSQQAAEADTPETTPGPEFAVAERLLRELGMVRTDLRLTFRNVRYLAGVVAEKLRSGVPVWEVHQALTHGLPATPIHNAAGFVTSRLRRNVPDGPTLAASDALRDATPPVAAANPYKALRTCDECCGLAFRPVGDETLCPACRRTYPQLEAALRQENPHQVWAPPAPAAYPEPAF
ncbi:hypothetical protein ACIO3O_07580 [Streptomyces sp. NPDC087440]|uniref:hypothetical protein n=1 Tax=Streptomyces sp. NPDC087440 TaxID=3365790 RepID=UPI0038258DA5